MAAAAPQTALPRTPTTSQRLRRTASGPSAGRRPPFSTPNMQDSVRSGLPARSRASTHCPALPSEVAGILVGTSLLVAASCRPQAPQSGPVQAGWASSDREADARRADLSAGLNPSRGQARSLPAAAARVNGHPILETEIEVLLRGRRQPGSERPAVLEDLIALELQAQAAQRLELNQSEEVDRELAMLEARYRQARRGVLAKAYRLHTVSNMPPPTSEEVDTYLAAHQDRLRTELQLLRLTVRSRAAAEGLKKKLAKGVSFESLVEQFPAESGPAGPLAFDAVPEAWWQALEGRSIGDTTEVIEAGAGRFQLLKLVHRTTVRVPPDDQLRRRVAALLRAEGLDAYQKSAFQRLRLKARIERAATASAP